jgi:hypothetical protein
MRDKELLQQALDVIEEAQAYTNCETFSPSMTKECAITAEAIRTRLAQPKPVGCIIEEHTTTPYGGTTGLKAKMFCHLPVGTLLYAAPPKKEWVSLTDKEVKQLSDYCVDVRDEIEFIRAIEEEIKEKNNG